MIRYIAVLSLLLMGSHADALTLHVEMTPELAGTNAVTMKALKAGQTRFTIRCRPSLNSASVSGHPLIRTGVLEVYGTEDRIMRCVLKVKSDAEGKLLYSFDLQDDFAKRAVFTLSEFRDDAQVGGGAVYSYRLINFIDPQHQQKEMLRRIEESRKAMLKDLKRSKPKIR